MNKKRIGAIAALLLIAGLYLAALVLAFMDSPFARSCLMAALFCTIVVPVVLYAYLMLIRFLQSRDQHRTQGTDRVTNGPKDRKD